MPDYRVNFFNNLINSNGRQFKCLQRSLIVSNALDEAEALRKAKRQFEQAERVINWALRAHFIEIEHLRNASESFSGGQHLSGWRIDPWDCGKCHRLSKRHSSNEARLRPNALRAFSLD